MTVTIHDHSAHVTIHAWTTGEQWSPEWTVTWLAYATDVDDFDEEFDDEVEETFQAFDEAAARLRHLMRPAPECCQ